MALFERIAAVAGCDAAARESCWAGRNRCQRSRRSAVRVGCPAPDGPGRPVRGARRPDGARDRLEALREAVETVAAMVEFQLSE